MDPLSSAEDKEVRRKLHPCVLCSCGVGILLAPWFYRGTTQAWCRRCRLEFNP